MERDAEVTPAHARGRAAVRAAPAWAALPCAGDGEELTMHVLWRDDAFAACVDAGTAFVGLFGRGVAPNAYGLAPVIDKATYPEVAPEERLPRDALDGGLPSRIGSVSRRDQRGRRP